MTIDMIVYYTFIAFLLAAVTKILPDVRGSGLLEIDAFMYLFVIILHMTYFTYFHGVGGRTPGKMIMGIKVIRDTGEEMTPGYAFLRWVGYLVSQIAFYLGFIWVAFDRRKQGWHDKIAGTLVVKTRGAKTRKSENRAVPPLIPPYSTGHGGFNGIRERFPY